MSREFNLTRQKKSIGSISKNQKSSPIIIHISLWKQDKKLILGRIRKFIFHMGGFQIDPFWSGTVLACKIISTSMYG